MIEFGSSLSGVGVDDQVWVLSVIGARVIGPDPVRDVWMPLSPGVEALYGLNGAGKTRLLRSVADLYSGAGAGYLVARAVPVERDYWARDMTQMFDRDVVARADPGWMSLVGEAPWRHAGRPSWHADLGDILWAHMFPPETGLTSGNQVELLAQVDEVVRQEMFALTPYATDRTNWHVAPAVLVNGDTPALQADVARLLHARDEYERSARHEGIDNPYDVESWDEEVFESLFNETMRVVAGHGDGVLTTLSPFFDILRDTHVDELEREGPLLEESALVPYRLGESDAFYSLGKLEGPVARLIRNDALAPESANRRTCDTLGATLSLLLEVDNNRITPSEHLTTSAAELSALSSSLYAKLLAEAPELRLMLKEPELWFYGAPAEWMAVDLSGRLVQLDQLSEAQRRWALIAIELALEVRPPDIITDESLSAYSHGWIEDRPLLVALDEPDGALHATAQRHAVLGLTDLARDLQATVICSTHSREFLNADDVTLRHVSRGFDGNVVVHDLAPPDRAHLDELGLEPADLFLLHRVILVVEGTHDEVVINGLIGDELRQARVLVIPMRGGRNLATVVDAHLLAQFSDAPMIAALDNLHAPKIQAFWSDLVAHREGGQDAFDRIVREHFSNARRDEETFLINYCRAAAESNAIERFQVFGLAEPDIPQYLPATILAPGLGSWTDLRSEFSSQSKMTSFKPWLKRRHGIEITVDSLHEGLAAMDAIPQEFVELVELCRGARRLQLSHR